MTEFTRTFWLSVAVLTPMMLAVLSLAPDLSASWAEGGPGSRSAASAAISLRVLTVEYGPRR